MDSPLSPVQQLSQELSSKEMIISKKSIQLSKVVGQGIQFQPKKPLTHGSWYANFCYTQESQDWFIAVTLTVEVEKI